MITTNFKMSSFQRAFLCFLGLFFVSNLLAAQNESVFNTLRLHYLSLKLKDISDLKSDFPKIKMLNVSQQSQLLEDAADSLALATLERRVVPNSSANKLYYILHEIIKREFGLDSKIISDASVIRDFKSDGISLVIYSTDPFENSSIDRRTQLSYRSIPLSRASANVDFTKQEEWLVAGTNYKAIVSVKAIPQRQKLVSSNDSPDYKKLTSDRTFNTIVIGDQSNILFSGSIIKGMTDTQAMYTLFLTYLNENKFEFESKTPSAIGSLPIIQDVQAYIKSRVVSPKNPVHFIYKDAHNGGEDKFIFRLAKRGRVLKAKLRRANFVENIEYIFPDYINPNTMFTFSAITNTEFGSWIKERESTSGLELIYLNGSCRSIDQAVYEVPAARTDSNILINLPTDVDVMNFSQSPFSATQFMFTAIRNQSKYSEMRAKLNEVKNTFNKSSLANNGRPWEFLSKSIYLLPNEEKYKKEILERALDVDVQVFKRSSDQSEWNVVRIIDTKNN